MVNLFQSLGAITVAAVLTALYYLVRGRGDDTARERFRGALWVSGVGGAACAALYWYLSSR